MVVVDKGSDPDLRTDAYPVRRTSARLREQWANKNESSASNHSHKRKEASPGPSRVVGTEKKMRIQKRHQLNGDCGPSEVGAEAISAAAGKSNHAIVIETLRTFNKHLLHFVQEEERRCANLKADKKKTKKNDRTSKKRDIAKDHTKNHSRRPDLKAFSKMRTTGAMINLEKRSGPVPGIDVGQQFFSRAEMVVVGFHQHCVNGIDYIGETAASSKKYQGLMRERWQGNLPLAISVVMSGQYEDDLDNCEEIVYTGQGGNNMVGNKRQIKDQTLERGNLGLKNCMEQSVPVRVVRGHACAASYVGKVYTYDGLYKVINYWAEKGVSGFLVYKFRLKRLEGQPPLRTKEVYFTRGRIPNSLSEIRGLVCEDITGGLEDIPIVVTNVVDDPAISALDSGFVYIKHMRYNKNLTAPAIAPVGCGCKSKCTDAKVCACAKLNGGDFPYVLHNGGRLIEPKAVVFECGPNCGCGPECINRTCQRGPRYRFEIFKTAKKGWGVRSWDHIPSGAPICEYIGLLRRTADLDPSADNSYVFDIDCIQTMKGLDGRESRLGDVSLPLHMQKFGEEATESVPFCIDAGKSGNFARFINHSCQPNLFVQCMVSSHHDLKQARIVLIAADNIQPMKELTYDYGYALDSVMGADGKIQQLPCFCGEDGCRKRLF